MTVAKRCFNMGSYADFKLFVQLFGNPRMIFWSNSPVVYIMNLDPTSDVAIWFKGQGGLPSDSVILADFPNAIKIDASDENYGTSGLLVNSVSNTNGIGLLQFFSYSYNEFKVLVSNLNLGGTILYNSNPTNFVASAYGADLGWHISFYTASMPSTFSTDFPNAIQVTTVGSIE